MQVEAIRFLVQAGCSASVQDSVASTPLHIAAGEGHIEAIKVLKSLVNIIVIIPKKIYPLPWMCRRCLRITCPSPQLIHQPLH